MFHYKLIECVKLLYHLLATTIVYLEAHTLWFIKPVYMIFVLFSFYIVFIYVVKLFIFLKEKDCLSISGFCSLCRWCLGFHILKKFFSKFNLSMNFESNSYYDFSDSYQNNNFNSSYKGSTSNENQEATSYPNIEIFDFDMVKSFSSLEDLKKEYKRLTLQYHPDRGGSHEDFLKLQNEYEFLKKFYHNF